MNDIILSGIVGSTAYGLNREGSDVDRLGVFVAPTLEVAGLSWNSHRESRVSSKPDTTLHEVAKWLRLALKGNPTILELVWLPSDLVEVCTDEGSMLVDLRHAVLSERAVRDAYGGYARQQAHRLRDRGDGSFSSDTRKRTTKHARHLLRLLRQGRELLETGQLTVRVPDPAVYWAMDNYDVPKILEVFEREDALLQAARSVLPARPDTERVAAVLRDIRRKHLD